MGVTVVGAVLVVAVAVDLLWTTLWADGGAGPITSRVSSRVWRLVRRAGGGRSTVASLAGPLVLLATLVTWVGLLWTGWTLVFGGSDTSLRDTADGSTVSWPGRVYFVGYTLFTMGNGDVAPVGGVWQVLTGLTTASGMLMVTLAVTYLLSVLGAVAQKRSFAGTVQGFGTSGSDLLLSDWNGRDLHDLDLPLSGVAADASALADKHRTYPVLHHYHSRDAKDAAALAVAVLDEALTLMAHGTAGERLYNAAVVANARSSVGGYLDSLHEAFIEPPPRPSLAPLRTAGVPTVTDEELAAALDALQDRRRRLLGVVHADAWQWPEGQR